ncbi:UNVERIFIED_CONTAM: hypothetical protein GTU68_044869, partial [Idotea baltica]|nr:hypothetical protein [Idotea baltica]
LVLICQTNIQFNNNKYYIIQLLKDDSKEAFSVWMRWGRVGCTGQNSLKPFGSNLAAAKSAFMKKFSDKTRNDWDLRDAFEKVPGKYDLLEMDYSDGKDEVDKVEKINNENKSVEKRLKANWRRKVKCLISLICDVKAMEAAVVEMKYDAKKAPLGKLTDDQVKAGYAALKQIEEILNETNFSNNSLLHACNTFYTRIPHYFGMRVPPMIRTHQEIREKMKLLEALGDIQAAMNVLNQPLDDNVHPVDQKYNAIQCDIETLDKADQEYKMLEKYLTTTHGKTHCMYKMKLIDIFKVHKGSEEKRFKDVGNRMLLWHGSRLTNWAGILSQGLRIAPPEAPCTGYMVRGTFRAALF